MENIITTKGLSKQYGSIYRVKDVDLNIKEGSIFGFLGPNGAGKSTTLKMILGLVKPTNGSIEVFGKQLNSKNRLSILKNVGSLIESPSYYGHLTGEENLKIMQKLLDVPDKNLREALRIVRLEGQKGKKVQHYSLGMKQRLGIAAAIMGFPKLLILDEPTNGLDPAGIQEIRELIISFPQTYGMTVVVSSHILSEIDQMANSVGIIKEGELVFQDSMISLHKKSKQHIAIRTLNNAAAKEVLASKGIKAKLEDNFLLFENSTDVQASEYNRLIVESGIGVIRLEEHRENLEDIFLKLTGKSVSL